MTAPRKLEPGIPLHLRLPNPPFTSPSPSPSPVHPASSAIADSIARATVSSVLGPAGSGKTLASLQAIHSAFPGRVSSAVYICAAPPPCVAAATGGLALHVARALATLYEGTWIDWTAFGDEALAALCIDLADERELLVVIDDLGQHDRREVETLLARIQAYARRSRWVAIASVEDARGFEQGPCVFVERPIEWSTVPAIAAPFVSPGDELHPRSPAPSPSARVVPTFAGVVVPLELRELAEMIAFSRFEDLAGALADRLDSLADAGYAESFGPSSGLSQTIESPHSGSAPR